MGNRGVILYCPNCGFNNKESARFCQKCGNSLNNYVNLGNENTFAQANMRKTRNNNIIIVGVTVIIIALIILGTFLLLHDDNSQASDNINENPVNDTVINELKVNTATFYLDGNPNTGITSTINVGKEHSGETMGVMTTFSRDGSNINNPSEYESCVVDNEGNLVFTDYTPIPRYPDYCRIGISFNNQTFVFGCDMGKYKGTQTSVPQPIS